VAKSKKHTQHLLIFLTVLVDLIGFGIVIPLLPLYAKEFDASLWQLGVLMALHSFMQFIFSPLLGKISDRVGRRPVLLISIAGNVVAYIVLASAGSLWVLFLARFLSGVSSANISTAQAYLADITAREKRAGAMGMIGAAFGLGFTLGPALAGGVLAMVNSSWAPQWLADMGSHAPFWAAALLSVVNLIWVSRSLPESLPKEKRQTSNAPMTLLPHHRFREVANLEGAWLMRLLAVYFFNVTAFSMMTMLFTLFTNSRFGFGQEENSWLFTLVGVVGVVIQGGMIRRIEPKVGAFKLAITGAVILTITLAAMPWTSNWTLLIAFTTLVAIGNSLVQPSLNTIASRFADEQSQGTALGLMASAGSLGRVVGPLLSGFLLSVDFGPGFGSVALWVSAGIAVIATVLLVTLGGERRSRHESGLIVD